MVERGRTTEKVMTWSEPPIYAKGFYGVSPYFYIEEMANGSWSGVGHCIPLSMS